MAVDFMHCRALQHLTCRTPAASQAPRAWEACVSQSPPYGTVKGVRSALRWTFLHADRQSRWFLALWVGYHFMHGTRTCLNLTQTMYVIDPLAETAQGLMRLLRTNTPTKAEMHTWTIRESPSSSRSMKSTAL